MSKQETKTKRMMTTRNLAYCALLAALSVVLARLIIPMPNATTRFSIEAVPIYLAGMLFGPMAGGLVGFCADFVGCLFSGFGYNPLFSLPPILYGVFGGVFRYYLSKKISLPRLALAFLPPVVGGSILWQSFALDYVYDLGFTLMLSTRAVQFAITLVVNAVIVNLLFRSKMFVHMGVWPPKKQEK